MSLPYTRSPTLRSHTPNPDHDLRRAGQLPADCSMRQFSTRTARLKGGVLNTHSRRCRMAKGISLHIGLNAVSAAAYGGWSGKLNACEADSNDMEALAKSRGFKTTKLLTKAGTRKKALAAVKSAATALTSGGIFFLTYC